MNLLALPAAALSLVGRKGTLVVAASLFVGLAVPALAAACKPFLGEAIVVMLALAFLRVDPVELRHHFTQPGLIAAATLWVMLVVPAALGVLFLAVGLDRGDARPVLHAGAADVGARPDVVAGARRADGARRGADACEPRRVQRHHAADRQPVQPPLPRRAL